MSLTISELESERAKILDEIESKATKFSQKKPSKEGDLSLNDWLNAAEEVMPKNLPPKQKTSYSNKVLSSSKPNNKASFFGVIIMLSLFLTILGVVYIAYSSIQKELQIALIAKQENKEQMRLLQLDMQNLNEAVASGGKSELFSQLEAKVIALETQVAELKSIVASQNDGTNADLEVVTNPASLEKEGTHASDIIVKKEKSGVVTEAILDQKLKIYTQQLESKIDKKLEVILQFLTKGGSASALPALVNSSDKINKTEFPAEEVDTPIVATVKTPVVDEPLVKLVTPVSKPKAPVAPKAPIITTSADVKWLLEQPQAHYILQLASMTDAAALNKIVKNNQLKDTKVLPQTRNNVTTYVLVTGSFADRANADALAKTIKSQSGITPWIRKASDLANRIQ
ncbi:SPOR domain-containing protein [Thiomicrorhabdus lithotrophica]|uniref:SPOR domain-containing protein n=1 Tax=Thiomicrorhabdus lithotrophica TaxID=2949997 RepID=A0ABY8CH15_9GAMM|nr:SPOR domain-containing protein [Thiomicrorhabdus lithotrophica]WEJ63733.1 SPOR domain-containing protein [Thiomicrorhabdus lithotrophica]